MAKKEAPELTVVKDEPAAADKPADPMDIVMLPMEDITPYWRNPRVNADAVDKVVSSIREYGMVQPLVLDAEKIIIVGDTRYRALTALGATTAPCVIRPLSRRDAKAYRIADNKTGEMATWDEDRLRAELLEIPDLNLGEWYTEGELQRLIGEATPPALNDMRESPRAEAETSRRTATADQIELTCTTCEFTFYVNRADLETRPGVPDPAG